MDTNRKSILYWRLLLVCLGLVLVITACTGSISAPNSDGPLQINDGVLKARQENGDLVPVAGDAIFEMVGALESTDPWVVAGRTLETNEATQISEGLQVGDLVHVQGTVLEDDTWVAYSIEPAKEQAEPVIILIGKVDSVDPWVVNGVELTVTDDTVITGDITPGMIVRAEMTLLPDGTWNVLSISPLGDTTETPGCITVIATVLSINGNEIQFTGWPTPVTLGEDNQAENDEEVKDEENDDDDQGEDEDESGDEDNGNEEGQAVVINPGDVVRAVVCVSKDGQIVIVQITVLNTEDEGDTPDNGEKVLVCHNASKNNPHTISIAQPAVPAHLAHGDTLGPCP